MLRAINLSGHLHMVPAVVNDDYVIRFAVCSSHATDDDMAYAWSVISEIADDIKVALRNSFRASLSRGSTHDSRSTSSSNEIATINKVCLQFVLFALMREVKCQSVKLTKNSKNFGFWLTFPTKIF